MKNRITLISETGEKEDVTLEHMSQKYPKISIKFTGDGGGLSIYEPIKVKNKLNIVCGTRSEIEIGKNNEFEHFTIHASNKYCQIKIGKQNHLRNAVLFANGEPNLKITIGDNCLFSTGIIFRASDGHTIFDTVSHQILNKPEKGIYIGNHVWIGQNVSILKDVSIPDNCIIGIGSIVLEKEFEKDSIIAGAPAKSIRTQVSWHRKSIAYFENAKRIPI